MMTREEARRTLLLYRPGTADAAEPDVAEALALAKQDKELSLWLDQHRAQQQILRAKIRQIPVPAGLKEQIISERPVLAQKRFDRRALLLAAASISVILVVWRAAVLWQQPPSDDTFANYRSRMVKTALRGYSMDFESSSPDQIRNYLAAQKVAEHYEVPAVLQKAAATGCAVEDWQGAKVAMLCFRGGSATPASAKGDLWLFVVDRASVKGAPAAGLTEFAKVNKLMTATWTQGDKLYLLGTVGDEETIRRLIL
jgi:hypothetical protein